MIDNTVEVFVFHEGEYDKYLSRVAMENISMEIGEWVEQWPNEIFFFARSELTTEGI